MRIGRKAGKFHGWMWLATRATTTTSPTTVAWIAPSSCSRSRDAHASGRYSSGTFIRRSSRFTSPRSTTTFGARGIVAKAPDLRGPVATVDRLDHPPAVVDAQLEREVVAAALVDQAVEVREDPEAAQVLRVERPDLLEHRSHPRPIRCSARRSRSHAPIGDERDQHDERGAPASDAPHERTAAAAPETANAQTQAVIVAAFPGA